MVVMLNPKVHAVMEEVRKVIRGKDEAISKVMMAILSGGHVLLEDMPGVGKTTLALAFSKALGLDFHRIQFTPDVVASDVIGFTKYDKQKDEFIYQEGAVMCNLLLADEINRTSSRTQAALLEVMEEKHVTVDGKTYPLPKPFHVIATQNPIGSHGTQPLPQSQLDRFTMKISIGYPDFQSQVDLLRDRQTEQPLDQVQNVLGKEELLDIQKEVNFVHVSDHILEYITHLTLATRNHPSIIQGVSPRGALALSRVAKAKAYILNRDYVVPEDVIDAFVDTCNHRIVMKAKISEEQPKEVLNEILKEVKTPDIQNV